MYLKIVLTKTFPANTLTILYPHHPDKQTWYLWSLVAPGDGTEFRNALQVLFFFLAVKTRAFDRIK